MKTPVAAGLIALTIVFTVAGQLLIKYGTQQLDSFPTSLVEVPAFLLDALTNIRIILGLASAVIAALTWIGAVSLSDISFAYPFMSLAIVLVLVLSPIVLGESIPVARWLGVALVCLGLLITART